MGVDADLIGVIAGSAAVGVLLCVIIVSISCVCYRRLESKRQKNGIKGDVPWRPQYPHPYFLGNGNVTYDPSTRIDGYRPRILSPNTPNGSMAFKTDSSRGHSPAIGKTPIHQIPYQQYPPTSPRMANGAPPNGCVLVRIPVTNAFGMPTETQDYYDAKAWHYRHGEFIQAEYYPDQPYHSTVKSQFMHPSVPEDHPSEAFQNGGGQGDFQKHQHQDGPDSGTNDQAPSETQAATTAGNHFEAPSALGSVNTQVLFAEDQSELKERRKSITDDSNPNSSTNCKVIKKQHNHVKMPEWMVREYEEAGESIEMGVEQPTPPIPDYADGKQLEENGQPGLVSVMVKDYSLGQEQRSVQDLETQAASLSTLGEESTSIIQDYSSTNYVKDFTITDYIDPPGSDQNANKIHTDQKTKDLDAAIRESKAAVLKQIREKVNESAERTPPVFTSTPRVEEIPAVDQSTDDTLTANRQRHANDGSVDILPPAAVDTPF